MSRRLKRRINLKRLDRQKAEQCFRHGDGVLLRDEVSGAGHAHRPDIVGNLPHHLAHDRPERADFAAQGQDIAGRNYYRPTDPEIAKKYAEAFPKVELFKIDDVFGGWTKAQKTHFADGGVFDQIYKD